ncbi:MAG: PilZ domain-containing protein [Acidobacteria bacterium]|nr:PilZ domain-containing protein [Acidobacteriota bacterium]
MEEESQEYVKPEIDKRQHRRARLVTQLTCEALGRQALLLTRDVSVGGIFVTSKEPFPQDSEVAVAFRLSPKDPLISCHGKVMYAIVGVGMGIMFSDLGDEPRQGLQKFIDAAD